MTQRPGVAFYVKSLQKPVKTIATRGAKRSRSRETLQVSPDKSPLADGRSGSGSRWARPPPSRRRGRPLRLTAPAAAAATPPPAPAGGVPTAGGSSAGRGSPSRGPSPGGFRAASGRSRRAAALAWPCPTRCPPLCDSLPTIVCHLVVTPLPPTRPAGAAHRSSCQASASPWTLRLRVLTRWWRSAR
jgi:hypothetical protein